MRWSEGVADRLRPHMPDLALPFEVPDELDEQETTAHHVEEMLAARVQDLRAFVRQLRQG